MITPQNSLDPHIWPWPAELGLIGRLPTGQVARGHSVIVACPVRWSAAAGPRFQRRRLRVQRLRWPRGGRAGHGAAGRYRSRLVVLALGGAEPPAHRLGGEPCESTSSTGRAASGGGQRSGQQDVTATTLMHCPAGRWLAGLAGLAGLHRGEKRARRIGLDVRCCCQCLEQLPPGQADVSRVVGGSRSRPCSRYRAISSAVSLAGTTSVTSACGRDDCRRGTAQARGLSRP
jgi:hypothetical protein